MTVYLHLFVHCFVIALSKLKVLMAGTRVKGREQWLEPSLARTKLSQLGREAPAGPANMLCSENIWCTIPKDLTISPHSQNQLFCTKESNSVLAYI